MRHRSPRIVAVPRVALLAAALAACANVDRRPLAPVADTAESAALAAVVHRPFGGLLTTRVREAGGLDVKTVRARTASSPVLAALGLMIRAELRQRATPGLGHGDQR